RRREPVSRRPAPPRGTGPSGPGETTMGSGIRAGVAAAVLGLALAACGGGAPAGGDWQALDDEGQAPGWPQEQGLQADQGLLANAPEGPALQRQAAPPPMPPPPDTSRLQTAQIVDSNGFAQP